MGKPMARNLLAAGFDLTVHSRSSEPVDELVAAGATGGSDPAAVASASDITITMLPDTPDVEMVLVGSPGVIEGAAPGSLVIDMSSIDPGATRTMAAAFDARGIAMLDAPVSGGERGAIDGTLSIMVGGTDDAFRRAAPIFDALGRNVVHIGPSGAGQVAKACNQLVVAATIEAVAEALLLAERSGVDAAKVREALLGGFATVGLQHASSRPRSGDSARGARARASPIRSRPLSAPARRTPAARSARGPSRPRTSGTARSSRTSSRRSDGSCPLAPPPGASRRSRRARSDREPQWAD